jgi:MoCo/4Fe-4S cofactor protein with predicted Tat translocation signal
MSKGKVGTNMTLDTIRTRLAGLEGRTYWRSLEELADTPEFRGYIEREFPAHASEFTDPAGRREFLKLMGASLALAGVSACTRQPEEKIVPYVRQPEEVVPGRPLFFATTLMHGGYAMPVLAENHMGRPTKIEGNPEHPASKGGTDLFSQAEVLSLYDPDRSRTLIGRAEVKTWSLFLAAMQAMVNTQKAMAGQGLRLLTEPITSPSVLEQITTLLAAFPKAQWHQWDPVFGVVQGGAPAAHALYRFDKADVVVALDSDFLGFGPGAVRYSKDFSSRRRVDTPASELNRMYAVEPVPTITGAKAEHRLALPARDVQHFAAALAAAVGAGGTAAATSLPDEARSKWIPAIAKDLQAHRGHSVVVAGERQPAAVHALAQAINQALGNVGTTVVYSPAPAQPTVDGAASLSALVADMKAGAVDALIILGGNPVFTAPADLGFKDAMSKVELRVHLGLYNDETAELCHWHVPEAHYLESWGDARSFDGTVTFMQPLIAPIYDGRQAIEILSALNGTPGQTAVDLVKDHWSRAFAGKTKTSWTLRDHEGKPFANAGAFWRHALHDGFLAGTSSLETGDQLRTSNPPSLSASARQASDLRTAAAPGTPARGTSAPSTSAPSTSAPSTSAPSTPAPSTPAPSTGFEVVFRPDPTILDGRYANNGWLQEMPKPLTKITWDNVAYVGVKTAERLGVPIIRSGNRDQDLVEIAIGNRRVRMPVWVLPGTAENVIAVHFGYGRTRSGRVGNGIGVDAFPLRTSAAPWFESGATVTKTGEGYLVASTQNHFQMEGRHPVRVVDHEEYRDNPKAVEELGPERPGKMLSLYPVREYNGHKWGMAIDLNSCTGCGVCVMACVAENNIAVVGKAQVERTREMHWIRVDTYFEGSPDASAPLIVNQPVPCQQCENAPCEVVCPVAATTHNDEGLNDMVYNRCVGTRYCSNNCPYKVRRFNFLLYSDFTTRELDAQRNPDVTIRSRGVMEKCTYCVQRISHARIDSKTEGREIRDGEIKTACEQACPADAIVFGNLNDPQSRVAALAKQDRNYGLLEDLNTRPRTTYLAVVRNPNKEME